MFFNFAACDGGGLYPHQADGLEWLLEHPNALLADDVGLGKTVTTCAYLGALGDRGLIGPDSPGRCLIVAPASLLEQWKSELARFLPGFTVEVQPHTTSPTARKRDHVRFPYGRDIELVSYEGLAACIAGYEVKAFRVVVLDEVSAIRGRGQQHAAVCRITGKAVRVLGLTATPMELDLGETHAILQACQAPGLPNERDWNRDHVTYEAITYRGRFGQLHTKLKASGINKENVPDLRSYLDTVTLRRATDEVGLRLPDVDETWHYVPLSPEQEAEYAKASALPRGLSRSQALEAACNHASGASAKAQQALSLLRSSEGMAIVYAFHLNHLDLLEAALKAEGIGYVRLDGRAPAKQRAERLHVFRTDPAIRVLLGNEVLERGLNLQMVPWLISLGVEWNPARTAQRVGRICRIGSPFASVRHDVIVTEKPEDTNRRQVSERRASDFQSVFGRGPSNILLRSK